MDLEHGLRTQRAVDDPRGLDDHAFDVEETFEYAVHQAFSVVRFFGRKTEYAETPPYAYETNGSTTNPHPRKQQ